MLTIVTPRAAAGERTDRLAAGVLCRLFQATMLKNSDGDEPAEQDRSDGWGWFCSRGSSREKNVLCSRVPRPHTNPQGAVGATKTFVSAGISKGEKQICRTLREAGYPFVILLKDGFPKPNDENAKYFKPCGVYFEICSEGRLLFIGTKARNV